MDIHLELGETISERALRDCLRTAGAIVQDGPDGFTGEFPTMAFFYDAYPAPRPLRAEHASIQPMIASELWLRPLSDKYLAAAEELARLVGTLAASAGGSFVLSDRYERIMAECADGALTLFVPLSEV